MRPEWLEEFFRKDLVIAENDLTVYAKVMKSLFSLDEALINGFRVMFVRLHVFIEDLNQKRWIEYFDHCFARIVNNDLELSINNKFHFLPQFETMNSKYIANIGIIPGTSTERILSI